MTVTDAAAVPANGEGPFKVNQWKAVVEAGFTARTPGGEDAAPPVLKDLLPVHDVPLKTKSAWKFSGGNSNQSGIDSSKKVLTAYIGLIIVINCGIEESIRTGASYCRDRQRPEAPIAAIGCYRVSTVELYTTVFVPEGRKYPVCRLCRYNSWPGRQVPEIKRYPRHGRINNNRMEIARNSDM